MCNTAALPAQNSCCTCVPQLQSLLCLLSIWQCQLTMHQNAQHRLLQSQAPVLVHVKHAKLSTKACLQACLCCITWNDRQPLVHSTIGDSTSRNIHPILPNLPLPPPLPPPPPPPLFLDAAYHCCMPLTAVQALTIKTAVEEPETDSERAVLLIERARDSKAPATRAHHLSQALQKLGALPAIQPPKLAGVYFAAESTDEMYSCR